MRNAPAPISRPPACPDDLRDTRDWALLLLGFAGVFGRSELVGLQAADLQRAEEGLIVTLRRSKTDQEGRAVGIPKDRSTEWPKLSGWLWR